MLGFRTLLAASNGASAAQAVVTFIESPAPDTSDTTNYTFSSLTLHESMLVYATRQGAATQGNLSLTIGGITATLCCEKNDSTNEVWSGLYYATGITPGSG